MSQAIDRIMDVPAPERLGQGTVVEQTRAIAQVQAMVVIARQNPRSVRMALREIEESCKQPALAERAFFRYPRAGEMVIGETIHLAREIARCWGNLDYGLVEMRRDDVARQSEMQVYAWDLQTNMRSAHTFIVPHARDKRDRKTGAEIREDLTQLRDIYENNTSNASRRLREAIFSVIPAWVKESAKDWCNDTLSKKDGERPLAQRLADMAKRYGEIGVSEAQIEAKMGRPIDRLTTLDLATLHVVFTSIRRGEATIDEEFSDVVSVAELVGAPVSTIPAVAQPPAATADQPAEPVTESEPPQAPSAAEWPATAQPPDAQPAAEPEPEAVQLHPNHPDAPARNPVLQRLAVLFSDIGVTDREERLGLCKAKVLRDLASSKDLTNREAAQICALIEAAKQESDPAAAFGAAPAIGSEA